MKDRRLLYLVVIIVVILLISFFLIFTYQDDVLLVGFLISLLIIAYSSTQLITITPEVGDIKLGREFKIISEHRGTRTSDGHIQYFYILEFEDGHVKFAEGEIDLGEEGKRYVMGKSNDELVTFPVSD